MGADRYAKAIIGAILAGLSALTVGVEDGVIGGQELGTIIGAVLGTGGLVWAVPNTWLVYAKTIIGAGSAGFTSLLAAMDDGNISGEEWYVILGGVVAAIGVYFVPNRPTRSD